MVCKMPESIGRGLLAVVIVPCAGRGNADNQRKKQREKRKFALFHCETLLFNRV
jgi:hypothetical protein